MGHAKYITALLVFALMAGAGYAQAELKILLVKIEPTSVAPGGSANVSVFARNSGTALGLGSITLSEPSPPSGYLGFSPLSASTGSIDSAATSAAVVFEVAVLSGAETGNYPIAVNLTDGAVVLDSATAYINVSSTSEGATNIPEIPPYLAAFPALAVLIIILRRR